MLGSRADSVLSATLYWFLNTTLSCSMALLASVVSFGESISSAHFLIRKAYLFIPLVPQQPCKCYSHLTEEQTEAEDNLPK